LYERKIHGLAPIRTYLRRVAINMAIAAGIMFVSLCVGIAGYRGTEGMHWIDALLNASMIMGGMGPVDVLKTHAGKLFASIYALYCGLVLILTAGIVLAPVVHRLLHRFHLEDAKSDS
jgi:hypothetical protein